MLNYNNKISSFIFFLLLFSCSKRLTAQDSILYSFVDANDLTVSGRAFSVNQRLFHRMDSAHMKMVPRRVSELSTNSAGICVTFKTNAKNIKLKWILGSYQTLWNMTPMAVNGIDLYGLKDRNWQYISSARPLSDSNEAVIINNLDGVMRHYRLYLPLYTELKSLHIGVDKFAIITKADENVLPIKKVVIYGSSITQGASASRPGMAYPSILSRMLNIETFNMGFSGSGKMEIELADVLADMQADVYILDCVPNTSPAQIKERAIPFIKRLRQLKPGIPIIMVESIIREDSHWNQEKYAMVHSQNIEFNHAYQRLKKERYGDLYYIPANDLIGTDHEATIDGTHLTDIGFLRLAKQISKTLRKLIN
jgi:hypothetical protein